MSSTDETPLPIRYLGWHYHISKKKRDPKNPRNLLTQTQNQINTTNDVCEWLQAQGFSQYISSFEQNEINGQILCTLTSEELRDDLGVSNLRHRRDLLDGVSKLKSSQHDSSQTLPEHGRILDHLSNVRTYHSWIRLGVQFLAFSLVTLRLAPIFRTTPLVTAAAFYYALVGILALLYGVFRYNTVINMIEASGTTNHHYKPDRIGILSMLFLVITASIITLVIISLRVS